MCGLSASADARDGDRGLAVRWVIDPNAGGALVLGPSTVSTTRTLRAARQGDKRPRISSCPLLRDLSRTLSYYTVVLMIDDHYTIDVMSQRPGKNPYRPGVGTR